MSASVPIVTLALDESTLHRMAELIAEHVVRSVTDAASSPWMGTRAAAEYLGLSIDALHRLSGARDIPHRKQGGRLLFNRIELDAWLDGYYFGPVLRGT